MKIISLRLKHFKPVKYSLLGREEIHIDLSSLPDGLVAIAGKNGAAKTTIIDNLQPFRVMPFRATQSLADMVYGEGEKELLWEHNGSVYRSLLKINGKTRDMTSYLDKKNEDGSWTPMVDGRNNDYDAAVEGILGITEKMFFTVRFRSQDARSFVSFKKNDFREVFETMIPELEYLLGVSERAKVKRKAAEDEHEKVLRQLSSVENVLSSLPAMVPPDEAAITDTEQVLSGKHARANELSELINNSYAAASALDEQIKSLTRSLSDSKGRLSQREREAEERINGIARKKRELNELLATKDSILNLKDRLPALKTKLAGTQAKLEKRNTLIAEITSISGMLTGTRAEVTALRKQLKEAHDIAKLLQEVPCSGEEKQSSCKLLADGVKKAAMVPGMEEELSYLMDSVAMAEQELKEKNLLLQSEYPEKTIPQGLLSELSEAQTAAARAELLLHAEEQLSELSAEEKKIDANLVEEQKKVADETASVNTALGKARTDREAITLKYNEHKNSKTVLETEMNEISSRLERLRTDRKLFEENERRKHVIGEEIRKYKESVDGFFKDARQWRHIEEGFGREGILSLELELAAPAVSDIANALLTEMGGRFAIRFDTLQPKMTRGKITGYKESFSVKVFDSEKGIEKDLVDLSGGERVWVDEAIARGISIYNSRNTGVDLGLLVSDEKDGALDSEKKLEYIAMKRKVLELGGDRQEIFISHTKDVWELADAVIEVSEAGIALRKGPSIEIDVNAGNNSAAITRGDELPLVENIQDVKKRKKKKEPLPLKQEPLLQVPGHDQVRNIPAVTEPDAAEQDDEERDGYSYMSPGRGM